MDGAEVEWWFVVVCVLDSLSMVCRFGWTAQCHIYGGSFRNRHLVDPRTSSGTLIVNYDSEDGE